MTTHLSLVKVFLPFFLCFLLFVPQNSFADGLGQVREDFSNPSAQFGQSCFWWWLNSNVDKPAIRRDLQAMKDKDFYGALVIDASCAAAWGNQNVPCGPMFGTPEWCELMLYALDEAERHGLIIASLIQSGWNLNGPLVTPEYASKHIVYTKVELKSGERPAQLEQPQSRHGFYRDIAVLAFPLGGRTDAVDRLRDKICDRELGMSAADGRVLLHNEKGKGGTRLVKKDSVIDLSALMDTDGNLDWTAPAAGYISNEEAPEWAVVRLGYTCTRARNTAGSDKWKGLVLDYLSREAFDFYWDSTVEPVLARMGHHCGKTFRYLATDSWECGGMNWTNGFEAMFKEYNGYDILPYLPVIAGYVVESHEETNDFLADFRKTVANAVAHNHYERFSERAHAHGMGTQPECSGPHAGPLDGIRNYRYSDIMMSEFWAKSPHRPKPETRFFIKQASSAAHLYGCPIVGAESFTTIGPHWNDLLWNNHKPAFDREVCEGLNRVYFHTFTCSPESMGLPGQEYFAGTHFNPNITWWEQAGAFTKYLSRVQVFAQRGKVVADALYYYGDHIPNILPFRDNFLHGYDYDACDEESLLQTRVNGGRIVTASGCKYRLLILPDHRVLSLTVLRHLETLVRGGAAVLGYKPEAFVSLTGDKGEFFALADRIWGKAPAEKGVARYGKGRVFWGCSAEEALSAIGCKPDFSLPDNCYTIHWKFDDADAWFISNQNESPLHLEALFRSRVTRAEVWDPRDGSIHTVNGNRSRKGVGITLDIEECGSRIIVFPKRSARTREAVPVLPEPSLSSVLDGPWTVHFNPEWGGPQTAVFDTLCDWTLHADEGIRYYSGTAVYEKDFEARKTPGDKMFLRLGKVLDNGIAEVRLNSRDLGIVWTSPFQTEITQALQDGTNHLEIMVVNSWFNRVAGDLDNPGKKRYTSTNVMALPYHIRKVPDYPFQRTLSPSGLLGPVGIYTISSR